MYNPLSYNNFRFREYNFKKYHYTDNRNGSPMNYIAYMISGSARIASESTTVHVRSGDIFFIPYRLPYQSYWYGDENESIRFLSIGFINVESGENINFALQTVQCDESIKELVRQIPVNCEHISCYALGRFYLALSQIMPHLETSRPISRKEELLKKAKEYIQNNTDCIMSDVAASCFISEPYLYVIFKSLAGCTPNEYKLEVRCKQGIEYLTTTDMTVEQISELIGFSSAAHFRRALKDRFGVSPREIRKNTL